MPFLRCDPKGRETRLGSQTPPVTVRFHGAAMDLAGAETLYTGVRCIAFGMRTTGCTTPSLSTWQTLRELVQSEESTTLSYWLRCSLGGKSSLPSLPQPTVTERPNRQFGCPASGCSGILALL